MDFLRFVHLMISISKIQPDFMGRINILLIGFKNTNVGFKV